MSDRSSYARPPRVLVAEDNQTTQTLVVGLLDQLGYASDVAPNGHAAAEAFERHAYVAVLMDCQMPDLDGLGATERIRAHEGEKSRQTGAAGRSHVPIIAMTANETRDRCLAAGMDDYIAKPLSIDTLRAVLDRCVKAPRGGGSRETTVSETVRRTARR